MRGYSRLTPAKMRKVPVGETVTEHGISLEGARDGDGLSSVNIVVDGQRVHRTMVRESDGTTRT